MNRERSQSVLGFVMAGSMGLAACGAPAISDGHEYESAGHGVKAVSLDINRSLVVTEQPILARFPFARVMNQLAAQSGVTGLTGLGLFQQWWDTQNPAAEGVFPGVHCDDQVAEGGGPGLNSYPYFCRPALLAQEGGEATSIPFVGTSPAPTDYIPIGLFNRFDLAPVDGSNCGEHRIVYARRSGEAIPPVGPNRERNLIIFEATMPNPNPNQGLKGCKKIVDFWADLSSENDMSQRATDLEAFYFDGGGGLPPVVSIAHFGVNADGVGQIRTNQFMTTLAAAQWNLREFKLSHTCAGGTCSSLSVIPVTVKSNPWGGLFVPAATHSRKPAFDTHFTTQVEALAASSTGAIDMEMPDTFNTAQSLSSGSPVDNYVTQFVGGSDLRNAIQAKLTTMGSTLTPDHIVKRAQALSCAGCHQGTASPTNAATRDLGGGLVWPASLGFVHVSEQAPVEGDDGVVRFRVSPALVNEFLPARKAVMEDFMNDKPPTPGKKPKDPIGGRRVH